MVKEIEADAKAFADPRRTLIQAEKKAVARSQGGGRAGHGGGQPKKAGCAPAPATATRRQPLPSRPVTACMARLSAAAVDTLLVFGSNGRVYSVPWRVLPAWRGDGQPVTTLIELEAGTQLLYYFAGPASASLLLQQHGRLRLYGHGGEHGFAPEGRQGLCEPCNEGETLCRRRCVGRPGKVAWRGTPAARGGLPATHVACASTGGRILTFEITELKTHGQRRARSDADRPGSQGHPGRCCRLHPQHPHRRYRARRQERDETLEIRSLEQRPRSPWP